MVLELVGVLDDGSPPILGQAAPNPRTTIRITQGQDVTIRLKVINNAGADIPLASAVVVLTAKKRPQDSKAFDKIAVVDLFSIVPADTKNLSLGRYIFDVWYTKAGKRDPVIPLSTLLLEATSTPVP